MDEDEEDGEEEELGGYVRVGATYCLHPVEQSKSNRSDLCERHVRSQWARQRHHCRHEVARGVDAKYLGEWVPGVLVRGGNGLYPGGIG